MQIIVELMEQLQEEMDPGADELGMRLGRKKPEVEVVSMEVEDPAMEAEEEMLGADLDGDMEMGEDPEHAAKVMGEDSLKKRLMKLRGA